MPRTLRVAAIVLAQPSQVSDAVAMLPAEVTAYLVETGAGVLVTLERKHRFVSRRRTIRSLQRELAAISTAAPAG